MTQAGESAGTRGQVARLILELGPCTAATHRRAARADAGRHPAAPGQPYRRRHDRDAHRPHLRQPGAGPPGQGLRHHRRGPQRLRARLRRPGDQRAALPDADLRPAGGRRVRQAAGRGDRAPLRAGGRPGGRPADPGAGARRRAVGRRLRRRGGPRARADRRRKRGSTGPGNTAAGITKAAHVVGNGEQICQHHCPVAHVAAEFPQLCEAETEAFGRLLGTPVRRLATIAHGDGICTTHVTCTSVRTTRQPKHTTSPEGSDI